MSVSYSDVAAMQSKINQIQRENSALQQELNILINAITDANNSVRDSHVRVKSSITNNDNVLKSGDVLLNDAYKVEQEVEAINKQYKTMEVSYKAVRSLTNQIRYNEGNNRRVNRIVAAIVDNLSLGLVSDENMESVAEKLHLETKSFYLSYIMMSLILWRKGEQTAAARAVEKAMDINFKDSCIFYMLFNFKFGRFDAAARWLDQILPMEITGADAGVLIFMMLAVMNDANPAVKRFSARAHQYIKKASGKNLRLNDSKLIKRISQKLYAVASSKAGEYELLKRYAADDYTNLRTALSYAISNRDVISYFENVQKFSEGRNASDYIDRLLDSQLQNMSTPETQKIEDEIRYHEAIIEAKGNIEEGIAKKAAADLEKMSAIVVGELLFDIVYSTPEKFKGKELLSRFAYKNISHIHKEAYARYRDSYHKLRPKRLRYKIDSYASESDFFNDKKDEEAITKHYEAERDDEFLKNKKIRPIVLGAIGAALGLALIILTLAQIIPENLSFVMYVGIAMCVLGALLIVLRVFKNKNLKKRLAEKYAALTKHIITEYHSLKTEYMAYLEDFREYDELNTKIAEFFV